MLPVLPATISGIAGNGNGHGHAHGNGHGGGTAIAPAHHE
jgi:hypothetical protein